MFALGSGCMHSIFENSQSQRPVCAVRRRIIQANSAASHGALVEATSTYAEELAAVKKNFESLKRGLRHDHAADHASPPALPAAAAAAASRGRTTATTRVGGHSRRTQPTGVLRGARGSTVATTTSRRDRRPQTVSQRTTESQVGMAIGGRIATAIAWVV